MEEDELRRRIGSKTDLKSCALMLLLRTFLKSSWLLLFQSSCASAVVLLSPGLTSEFGLPPVIGRPGGWHLKAFSSWLLSFAAVRLLLIEGIRLRDCCWPSVRLSRKILEIGFNHLAELDLVWDPSLGEASTLFVFVASWVGNCSLEDANSESRHAGFGRI